jgi:hypothetical protein
VVLNDMCAKKKWWLKCELLKSIPLHIQKQNFGEYIYKHTFIHSIHFKGSCWGGGIELELIAKTWACKKNSFYRFSQLPIRKCLSWSTFPYA